MVLVDIVSRSCFRKEMSNCSFTAATVQSALSMMPGHRAYAQGS
jgi:hypothetical protein